MTGSIEGRWLLCQYGLTGYWRGDAYPMASRDEVTWANLQGFLAVKVYVQRANRQVALLEGLKAAAGSMRYLRGLRGIRCVPCILDATVSATHRGRDLLVASSAGTQKHLPSTDNTPHAGPRGGGGRPMSEYSGIGGGRVVPPAVYLLRILYDLAEGTTTGYDIRHFWRDYQLGLFNLTREGSR